MLQIKYWYENLKRKEEENSALGKKKNKPATFDGWWLTTGSSINAWMWYHTVIQFPLDGQSNL